jgi:hypothetical protein
MDMEFHYYVNYLIAVASGFKKDDAIKIAYSAQYVDDNNWKYEISDAAGRVVYNNQMSQTCNLTLPEHELKRIMTSFHFIPGDLDGYSNRRDNRSHHLNTSPNSFRAKIVLRNALKSENPYLIGIASHAFCDTWAHQNFTGTFDEHNSIDGFPQNIIPNIGHADAFDWPDQLDLEWFDWRLKIPRVNNIERCLFAASVLFSEYCKSNKSNPLIDKDHFLKKLQKIFGRPTRYPLRVLNLRYRSRVRRYNQFASELTGFGIPKYDPKDWLYKAVSINPMSYTWANKNPEKTDWFLFQNSVKSYSKSID